MSELKHEEHCLELREAARGGGWGGGASSSTYVYVADTQLCEF